MAQGNKIIDLLGGRKFAAALLALALGTAVELLKPGGLGEAYVMLLVGTVGVFSGANALVSWRGLQVGESSQAPTPPTEPPPVSEASPSMEDLLRHDDRIVALEEESKVQAEAIAKTTQLIAALIQQQQQR